MKQIISLAVTLTFLFACGGAENGTSSADGSMPADSAALRVAVMPTLDCLPLFLASEHNMFRRAGIDVALVCFNAQMDCDTALISGYVGATVTDLVRTEHLRRRKVSTTCLTATDASWQLLSARTARIRRLPQIDDRMVGMARYSATDMLAALCIDSAKLKEERVYRIQVNDVGIRLNMLQNNIIDAALMPEPQATAARLSRAFLLADASRRFGLRLGVVAMRDSCLSASKADAFRRAYDEACDSLNANGLKVYSDIIVRKMGVTRQTVDSMPDNITFRHAAQPRPSDVERAKAWLTKKLGSDEVKNEK